MNRARMHKLCQRFSESGRMTICGAASIVRNHFKQYENEQVVKFSGYKDKESDKLNMVTVQTDQQIAIFKKNESGDWKVGSCSPLPRY